MNAQHSSISNEHFTPRVVVNAARRVMGSIDLDPFSCEAANENVQAKMFFCLPDPTKLLSSGFGAIEVANGFTRQWETRLGSQVRVLCNPPGGTFERGEEGGEPGASRQAVAWFKHVSEWLAGRVICGIHVCFSLEILQRTQMHESRLTAKGALPIPLDFPICYPAQRLRYDQMRNGKLVPGAQPPHASCIVYLPNIDLDTRMLLGQRQFRINASSKFVDEFGQFGRVVVPA